MFFLSLPKHLATISRLTQHLLSGHINPGHTKRGIRVGRVLVNGELPVMDAPREADRPEGDPLLPTVDRHRVVVVGENHARAVAVAQLWVKREPSNYMVWCEQLCVTKFD